MNCPCGQTHDGSPSLPHVARLVEQMGETVVVTVPGGSWHVPRIYIAMHGLKAEELKVLADKYGWKKLGRDVQAAHT